MNNSYSILNVVQATHADYVANGSNVIITGLDPFKKANWVELVTSPASSYRTTGGASAQGFYTLDTNCTISASGVTLTWSAGTPDTYEGEVLTVTKGGVTYYGVVTADTTGATTTIAGWFASTSGTDTPADAAGYTVTRQGYASTKVVFASITSKYVNVATKITSILSGIDWYLPQFGYSVATTATAAEQGTAYFNVVSQQLANNGYSAVDLGTGTVYLMHPPNVTLIVEGASTATYTAPAITPVQPVNRVGYGADLIPLYATALSTTEQQAIISTSFYDQQFFKIVDAETKEVKNLRLLTNITNESTDGPALTAYIITQAP